MFIVAPALYEPFEVVEEKLVRVGAVESGATRLAPEQEEDEADGWLEGPLTPVVLTFRTQGLKLFSYQLVT